MKPAFERRIINTLLRIDQATGQRLRAWAPRRLIDLARRHRGLPGAPPIYSRTLGYVPPTGLVRHFNPLNIAMSSELADRPRLNVLLPSTATKHLTGGPNTALNIAVRLAAMEVPVRFISTDAPPDNEQGNFTRHVRKLTNIDLDFLKLEIVDASSRQFPFVIGRNDVFLATAWWTAQMAKYAMRQTTHSRFVYLIQDYEPLLHPASSEQALAEETYSLDHIPVINTSLLHEFLSTRLIGLYSSQKFAENALVFEPAIDTSLFFAEQRERHRNVERRRLLFYARPNTGRRNLFELGVAALQKLILDEAIDPRGWEFIGMGEAFRPVDLGRNAKLRPAPWLNLEAYAKQMRAADVLLSLMLSPHPSYPPLEMAACGGQIVTTIYANKTAKRLAAISPNIIGVPASIDSIAAGLLAAMQRSATTRSPLRTTITGPATWSESLSDVVPRLHFELLRLFEAPNLRSSPYAKGDRPRLFPGYTHFPTTPYESIRFSVLKDRRPYYQICEKNFLSFITTIWNTEPEFLAKLAEAVFGQDSGSETFEWVILDNGTDREETRKIIERIATHPSVRLDRVEENIGIVRGLRQCLERARNRYVVPLDSDDLISPDCVRILSTGLANADYPALAYTDEDKVSGDHFRDPYCKPDWDPVLFIHSCYVAHLGAIDRKRAIELDAYTNLDAEGAHDWDTFLRFWLAGHKPLHIPEIVYSWRMHPQSTSENINSKDYIYSSHKSVINRFISTSRDPLSYKIELSPLFKGKPDWRLIKSASPTPLPITTVVYGDETNDKLEPQFLGHRVLHISADLSALLGVAMAEEADGRFIHVLSDAVKIDDPTWAVEALTLMELFPDTAIVGGRSHQNGVIVGADYYLGFGAGCDSPNAGRSLSDPGYFAQMWKPHSADAVPIEHCVVRAKFLGDAIRNLIDSGVGFSSLAFWLGAAAREKGLRVIFTPFLSASLPRKLVDVTTTERTAFCIAYDRLMPNAALMSPRLGITPSTAYEPISRTVRADQEKAMHLLQHVDDQLAESIANRVIAKTRSFADRSGDSTPAGPPFLSILTTVWNTSPTYISALADSIFGQDVTIDFEWIVLDNGSIRTETIALLSHLAKNSAVRLLRINSNIGIVGGLKYCLDRALGEYIVPVDSDDVLTTDAFRHIRDSFNTASGLHFVFSDEAILDHGRIVATVRRAVFDPILNSCDSYIWHLCAFQRKKALELGVYSETSAEFCHDWDTVSRFAIAGVEIQHVPHILYHWRMHTASSSNSGTVNPGSMRSVKQLLERIISRQERSELYEIRLFPINRGAEQYAIMRRHKAPLPIDLLYLDFSNGSQGIPAEISMKLAGGINNTYVVPCVPYPSSSLLAMQDILRKIEANVVMVLAAGLKPRDALGLWDAMSLFEFHPDVAAVAGRITDEAGKILSACEQIVGPGSTARSWIGSARTDPGDQAMALKQQTVAGITPDYFFCRTDILLEATSGTFPIPEQEALTKRISAIAQARGMRLAYSPLIEAIKY
jgi:O-antigen biosynthesis protein